MAANNQKPKIAETVSITAHQMKTPLVVIKGYLEALLSGSRGALTERQAEYVRDAMHNTRLMADVIDNLLDVSRIEKSKFTLYPKTVQLTDITAEVVGDLSFWTKANNTEVTFEKPDAVSQVHVDPVRIRQVIQNFISNAVMYKEGKGSIELQLREEDGNVVFECIDDGVGISKEDEKHLFTKFYRSDKSLEMDPTGSGLGLYVNKAVVELSGGKVWGVSNEKGGATFGFSLPVVEK